MLFSAVSENGGDFKAIAYPADEFQQQLANPVREGWTFDKWLDAEGEELVPENMVEGMHCYACWVDKNPPLLTVSCTKNCAPYQEVTMQAEDIASGIYGYYAGIENPQEQEVLYTENGEGQYQIKIETPGTCYFSVKDVGGNSKTECLEFISVSFTTGEGEETDCTQVLGKAGDTLSLPGAKKRGHTLSGWILDDETASEEQLPVMEHTFTCEVTFEPVFIPNQYQIYFDSNGGSCDVTSTEVTFGDGYPEFPEANRTGYLFLGWTREKDGEVIPEGQIYDTDGDVTLYAKWEPIHYTVRYLGNGNTAGEMECLECVYDMEFVHPRNAYMKEGYVFKGWSVSPDTISTQNALNARDRSYNGAEWLNEDRAINLTAEAECVVDLYAVWQKIEVGVMDYRYCMGKYMYFACTTLNYKTENAEDNGALFVGITPAGDKMFYGENAVWATSHIRTSLNDLSLNDMTGIKLTNTTVNNTYAGMMWEYDPNRESPCTLEESGYGTKIIRTGIANKNPTEDYIFIPDLRDCYNYYKGNDWNWFWDMNLDGTPDTFSLVGMHNWGPDDSYYTRINEIKSKWRSLGWSDRYWLRNQYTGWGNYPFYISQYGVSSCNPKDSYYASSYGNLAFSDKYYVRPMYTMTP